MEDIKNTVGETGENSQGTNDVNLEVIQKTVSDTLTAIFNKNTKNEKSIVNDNFSKLTEEERNIAFDLFNKEKNKEADKIQKAQQEKDTLIQKLQDELNVYKTKEKQNLFNNSTNTILEELSVTEDGHKNQTLKILNSSHKLEDFFTDNEINNDKIKEAINSIITDIPELVAKKNKVKIDIGKYQEGDELIKQEQDRIRSKWFK